MNIETIVLLVMITVCAIRSFVARCNRYVGRPYTARVELDEDSVSDLARSGEEFCLILRPFGSDGYVTPSLGSFRYLEDVISKAARTARKMETYELVDSRDPRKLVGPISIRVQDESWQECTSILIDSAHSIVMILSPAQGINGGFVWEIQQIARRGLRGRTVLVIPPAPRSSPWYASSIHAAARIVCALDGSSGGSVNDVDPVEVEYWYKKLSERHTLGIRIVNDDQAEPDSSAKIKWSFVKDESPKHLSPDAYASFLVPAICHIDNAIGRIPSDRRYPNRPG